MTGKDLMQPRHPYVADRLNPTPQDFGRYSGLFRHRGAGCAGGDDQYISASPPCWMTYRDGAGQLMIDGTAIQAQQGTCDLGCNARHHEMLMLSQQLARKADDFLLGFSVTEHDGRKSLPCGPQHILRCAIAAPTGLL